VRILILDDHVLVREGLGNLILSLMPSAQLLFANDCSQALELGDTHKPHLAFIDLNLPGQPGFFALEHFRALLPETTVVVVSGDEDSVSVIRALDMGATAFLPKSASSQVLRSSINRLLHGHVVLPQSVVRLAKSQALTPDSAEVNEATPEFYAAKIGITVRQFHVLGLVVAGLPNKIIARQLNIAEATVKIHVSAGLRALKVKTRTQALVEVARLAIPFGRFQ
jgi:DNA-binding NarL/FixJ family response regulator